MSARAWLAPAVRLLAIAGVRLARIHYPRLLDAALLLAGGAAVVTGVAQIYRPAAWIVGGMVCIALGMWPTRRT